MKWLGRLGVVTLTLLGGCSVPSVEELEAERSVLISVQGNPEFRGGCIVMRTQDAGWPTNFTEQAVRNGLPSSASSPLMLRASRQSHWGKRLQISVVAYEKSCEGKQVDRVDLFVDLAVREREAILSATLSTPDEDRDGYIAMSGGSAGGTDCNDADSMVNPSQRELCNDRDDNCSGVIDESLPLVTLFRDVDGDGVGGEPISHCEPIRGVLGYASVGGDCKDGDPQIAPGKAEVCDEQDNNCNGVVDEGHNKKWHLDNDGDGVPTSEVTFRCSSPGPKYMLYPAGAVFDCDDDDDRRTPGKEELCDGVDNDCADIGGVTVDEYFPAKGGLCVVQGCVGQYVCDSSQTGLECGAKAPRLFYPDVDGDLDGSQDASPEAVCEEESPPAGYVENAHGDCDDKDSARSSLILEMCDAVDNNCSGGVLDEPTSCGGTLKRVDDYHLSSSSQRWNTVSVHPSGYPVWIAGEDGKLAIRRSATSKFESFSFGDPANPTPADGSLPVHSNSCGDIDWRVSWVASNGWIYLAGGAGALGFHSGTTSAGCSRNDTGATGSVTGLIGFENSEGEPTLYVTDADGKLFRWVVGVGLTRLDAYARNFHGLHALKEELLLVVGGITGATAGQRFYSYGVTPGGGVERNMHTFLPIDVSGFAKAVWMGSNTKACAVGDHAAVWRWDGMRTWNLVDAPSGMVDSFTSVVMRSDASASSQRLLVDHCYMVDGGANGRLRRLTPYGWAKGPDLPTSAATVPLNDLAITPAGEIWVVGDDGRVFHYPEP